MNLDASLDLLAREPTAPLDLAELALWLARDEFPHLDVEAHLNELEAMAHEVKPYLRGSIEARAHGLCRYLFHEMGFRGNLKDYYDPRNSYLNQVLERKTGIPISLSVITLAVGQRAGLTLAGVGLPGHFVVKLQQEGKDLILDPFHGGRVLSPADCEVLVHQVTGQVFHATAENLQPLFTAGMVQRMLNNLRSIYFGQHDFRRAARILERLRQINPGDPGLLRDLGASYFGLNLPGRAVDYLRAYLDADPHAQDRAGVVRILKEAEKTLAEWN